MTAIVYPVTSYVDGEAWQMKNAAALRAAVDDMLFGGMGGFGPDPHHLHVVHDATDRELTLDDILMAALFADLTEPS